MKLKRLYLLIVFAASISPLSAQNGRQTISFNSGWFFKRGVEAVIPSKDSEIEYRSVILPHTWNKRDILADGKRGYYRGVGWYKKAFTLHPLPGKFYFLHFEGVGQSATVFINGHRAGAHAGGYTAFNIDITPFLRQSGEQNVTVEADNAYNADIPPLSGDFTFFGGIYRPVSLITTNTVRFSMNDFGGPGVYISSPLINDRDAELTIRYRLQNAGAESRIAKITSKIVSPAGDTIAFGSRFVTLAPFTDSVVKLILPGVKGFTLWSPDDPVVYSVLNELTIQGKLADRLVQPFGFRWFHFDADRGFFLNGKHVKLMGAARHQDRIPYGNALNDDMHRQDMGLLKDMGANFVRMAHYPQSQTVINQTDKLGLLVWEEIPLVNEITLSQAFDANALHMLKEMIKQNYNHPSIIIWGYMNEISWAHRFKPEKEIPAINRATVNLAKALDSQARALDTFRYTAIARHNYPPFDSTGIGSIPMIVGWNLYQGWYYDKLKDFGKFMDEHHKKYPGRIYIITEYGCGADTRIYSDKPERFDFSMEYQVKFLQSYIKQIRARPYIAGASVWNLADFSSEDRADAMPHVNSKGLLTAGRKPKDSYGLVKASLSETPVSILGYPFRRQWLYAAQSKSDTLVPVNMYAFSNRDTLTLMVDGLPFTARVIDGMARWSLRLPDGRHRLELVRPGGNQIKPIVTKLIPFDLQKDVDLAINMGCEDVFIDHRTGEYWLPEQAYKPGSWGYIGGEPLYSGGKPGTKEDILGVRTDPLYQTMRTGIREFRADVPDGNYIVEIAMVDYFAKKRRFITGDSVTYRPGGKIFSVSANGEDVIKSLDIGKDFGLNVPAIFRFPVRVTSGRGLQLKFNVIKGNTMVSAIRIRGN